MTTTTVTYHNRQPAINVKLHVAGLDLWPPALLSLPEVADGAQEIGRTTAADLLDAAYNITAAIFWDDAAFMATEVGLGTIYQDGRSGGWLVIDNDPTHGGEDDAPLDWLDGYRTLAGWCDAFLADASRKVRSLALTLAMDEIGRPAAERMVGAR